MGIVTELCRCLTCGKSTVKVEILIMLDNEKRICICNECIDDCNDIIADKRKERESATPQTYKGDE